MHPNKKNKNGGSELRKKKLSGEAEGLGWPRGLSAVTLREALGVFLFTGLVRMSLQNEARKEGDPETSLPTEVCVECLDLLPAREILSSWKKSSGERGKGDEFWSWLVRSPVSGA